jgi:hypothetical protein
LLQITGPSLVHPPTPGFFLFSLDPMYYSGEKALKVKRSCSDGKADRTACDAENKKN